MHPHLDYSLWKIVDYRGGGGGGAIGSGMRGMVCEESLFWTMWARV